MLSWKSEAQGTYITLSATDGDYRLEVIPRYEKQRGEWSVYYKKKLIARDYEDSIEHAKHLASASKIDHMHGLQFYPGPD